MSSVLKTVEIGFKCVGLFSWNYLALTIDEENIIWKEFLAYSHFTKKEI